MADARLARPLWRGRTNVDALTIAAIERAEEIGGHEFTITQGSYQSTVSASAGTHDRGGAVDLRWCGHDGCIRALRRAGMAAWHRTPSQGPWPDHIHAVVIGHPDLAPAAARQVESYRAGRNGLANNGADDGPRVPIHPPTFPWPEEDQMTPQQMTELKNHITSEHERFNRLDRLRDQRIAKRLSTKFARSEKEILAAIAEVDAEDEATGKGKKG